MAGDVDFPEMSLENFSHPITSATRTQFLSGKTVAPHMIQQGSAVIMKITARELTLRKRLPSSADAGDVAALMASDYAGTMTGTVANMTCGQIVD